MKFVRTRGYVSQTRKISYLKYNIINTNDFLYQLFYFQANIVAQTKINFNEQQFHLLMYQHLMTKGLSKTADSLVQEANLNVPEKKSTHFTYIFHYHVSLMNKKF